MDYCSCWVLTQEFAQGAKKSSVSRTEITERRTRRSPKEGNMFNVRQLTQATKRFRI